jgi:DNA-binding NarL/FixJ family response regulator
LDKVSAVPPPQRDSLSRIRLILADDHPDLLLAVTQILESQFEIVATACDGLALMEAAARLKPDALIMDISMPNLSGLEAARKLKEDGCTSKIVFLTIHTDPDIVHASLETGAYGYVIKPRIATDLVPAIRDALAGIIFVSPSVNGHE